MSLCLLIVAVMLAPVWLLGSLLALPVIAALDILLMWLAWRAGEVALRRLLRG